MPIKLLLMPNKKLNSGLNLIHVIIKYRAWLKTYILNVDHLDYVITFVYCNILKCTDPEYIPEDLHIGDFKHNTARNSMKSSD